MAYVEGRSVHDADSHLMELPDSLDAYLDPEFRAAYDALPKLKSHPRNANWVTRARTMQDNADFRSGADANVLLRKNYEAHGAFRREDRAAGSDPTVTFDTLRFTLLAG